MRYVIKENGDCIWIEDTERKCKEYPVVSYFYNTKDSRDKLENILKQLHNSDHKERFVDWLKND